MGVASLGPAGVRGAQPLGHAYQRADAFLFGRRTYELFTSWGSNDELRAHPIGVALNGAPKYVGSTTLTAGRWAGTTVLRDDLAAAIDELRARPGVSCRCTAVAP